MEWNLRPPAVGLLNDRVVMVSLMIFVLTMLSTVTFDGFLETQTWQDILNGILSAPVLSPLISIIRDIDLDEVQVVTSAALVAFPLIFLAVFASCSWLMVRVTALSSRSSVNSDGYRTIGLACAFVLTLVPIAIAYHLAHYLGMLLTTGQFVIALISDPFGFGWDLWGTADFKANIGFVGARFVWYAAVSAIVLGHVFAVYLAHVVAIRLFSDAHTALVSQIPMVALMVLYTMVSLWILAQPIVA